MKYVNQEPISQQEAAREQTVKEAFYNSFNQTDLGPEEVTKRYFSPDFKFYAGDTNKVIDYTNWPGRVQAVRKTYQSVNVVYKDFIFSSNGSSLSETHYIFGIRKDGKTTIIQTNNIIQFDANEKIKTIHNVEHVIVGNKEEVTHDAYMTE